MSEYKKYINEIEKRKALNLNPKPIDTANLIKEIILQIKDENHPEREKSLDFLIYNVLPGTTSAAVIKADFLKDIITKKESIKEINEDFEPVPVLDYAKGKLASEQDLFKSDKNFVILRLGSLYGYSLDSTRLNIMPNLFSKITSQDGVIKLFSGGKQLKSLVSIIDVVRCMKFVEENKEIILQSILISVEGYWEKNGTVESNYFYNCYGNFLVSSIQNQTELLAKFFKTSSWKTRDFH